MADSTKPYAGSYNPEPKSVAAKIADGVRVIHRRFCGLRGPGHATSQGDVGTYTPSSGLVFAGLAKEPGGITDKTGDTSATPPPEVGLPLVPEVVLAHNVTGVTGDGDVLKPVYASDNQTLTLTRPAADAEVAGLILAYNGSGTSCKVLFFGLSNQCLLGMAGGNRQILELGSYDHADLTDGDKITGMVMPFHGKFVSLHGIVEKAFTGSGGTATFNLEIGTTDVTGGALVASTAAGGTVGTKLDATAITAANEFHEGDAISLETSSGGGTQTAGRVRVYAIVERLPGA